MTAPVEELTHVLDGLAPPCEARHEDEETPAATWAWRILCPRHGLVLILYCDAHHEHYLDVWARSIRGAGTKIIHEGCTINLATHARPTYERL